jgi:hypothetical protein
LVHEFKSALDSLQGASDLLARRRHELDEVVLADLCAVIDRQAARVAWLVRVLEAVDGDGSSRRIEPVHGATVARQAAAANDMVVEIAGGAERDDDTFLGDPERVRLGLEILFEALHSPAGSVAVAMAVGGDVTAVAPALDLDETRVEVRLGPRKKGT